MVLLNFRQLKLSHEIPVESSKNILLSLQDNSAFNKFGFCFVNVVLFFISSRGFLLKNITGPCFHVFDCFFFMLGSVLMLICQKPFCGICSLKDFEVRVVLLCSSTDILNF